MFSPGGIARGAGESLPVGSPLRPSLMHAVPRLRAPVAGAAYDFAPGLDDPVARANLDLIVAALPAIIVGAGGVPPPLVAGVPIPAADSAANFLGSGAAYDILLDIGNKLAVAYLGKAMKKK